MIREDIIADRNNARKMGDTDKYKILTVLLGEFDRSDDKSDEKAISIIKKLMDACEETESWDERAMVEKYLPRQLGEDEIKEIFEEIRSKNADAGLPDFMKFLKQNYQGLFDGKVASTIARQM